MNRDCHRAGFAYELRVGKKASRSEFKCAVGISRKIQLIFILSGPSEKTSEANPQLGAL